MNIKIVQINEKKVQMELQNYLERRRRERRLYGITKLPRKEKT